MAKREKLERGNLERHGAGYRWTVRVNGDRHREVFDTDDELEAIERANARWSKMKDDLKRGRGLPRRSRVSELLDKFEREVLPTLSAGTQRSYRDSLKPLRAFFKDQQGDRLVSAMDTPDVEAFMSWRRAHPLRGTVLSERTLQKDRTVLFTVLEFARRLGLCTTNPVGLSRRPDAADRRHIILTDEVFEILLGEIRDLKARFYALFLNETGMRAESEALFVQRQDVDARPDFIEVVSGRGGHSTKNGESRWVPITARLRVALDAYLEATEGKSKWLFFHTKRRVSKKGKVFEPGDRVESFREAVMAAAKRAGVPDGFHIHDLRHRRAVTWIREGQHVVDVKDALGHSDLKVTMLYVGRDPERLRRMIRPSSAPEAPAPEVEVAP